MLSIQCLYHFFVLYCTDFGTTKKLSYDYALLCVKNVVYFQVVVIQACQTAKKHVPLDVIKENLNGNKELEDVYLVMTAKPGESYDSKPHLNFTKFFAEEMRGLDGTTDISAIVQSAEAAEYKARQDECMDGSSLLKRRRSYPRSYEQSRAPTEGSVAEVARKRKGQTLPRRSKEAKASGHLNLRKTKKSIHPSEATTADDSNPVVDGLLQWHARWKNELSE